MHTGTLELRNEDTELVLTFPYNIETRVQGIAEVVEPMALRPRASVHVLREHDPGRVIARVDGGSIENTTTALQVVIPTVDLSVTQTQRDALAEVRLGLVDGVSPGFTVAAGGSQTRAGVRHITRADLVELSLVTRPAYSAATAVLRNETVMPSRRRLLVL